VSWVPLGEVKLTEGDHTLRIELIDDSGADFCRFHDGGA
jgi:hypothetical protein